MNTEIYHYSTLRFNSLLTKREQNNLSKQEILDAEEKSRKLKLEGPYIDHISFFFDPIPSKLLAELYGPPHEVWVKDTKLFEYVVDAETLDNTMLYRVVESFRKTALLDKFSEENSWTTNDPSIFQKWMELWNRKSREWRELGENKQDLLNQIKLNKGKTELGYKLASKRSDFEDGKSLYAANVPHLMVYPKSGEIKFKTINELKIGNDARKKIFPSPTKKINSLEIFM